MFSMCGTRWGRESFPMNIIMSKYNDAYVYCDSIYCVCAVVYVWIIIHLIVYVIEFVDGCDRMHNTDISRNAGFVK